MECHNATCEYFDKDADNNCTAFSDKHNYCIYFTASYTDGIHGIIEQIKKSCDQVSKLVDEMKGDD